MSGAKPSFLDEAFGIAAQANEPKQESGSASLLLTPEESIAYAQYFRIADSENEGVITPQAAVAFLSKSSLSQNVLRDIWALADSEGLGYLTQPSFYKALKLIALVQSGKPASVAYLSQSTPLPNFGNLLADATPGIKSGGIAVHRTGTLSPQVGGPIPIHKTGSSFTSPAAPIAIHRTGSTIPAVPGVVSEIAVHRTGSTVAGAGAVGAFQLSNEEVERFKAAFASCNPAGGYVAGDSARELFLKSTLPAATLRQIWLLVDTNQLGKLALNQFMAAMYLITKIRNGQLSAVPATIPPALWAAVNAAASGETSQQHPTTPIPDMAAETMSLIDVTTPAASPAPVSAPVPVASPPAAAAPPTQQKYNISNEDKAQYFQYFEKLDAAKRGYVT
ncbi:hypothetical protein HK102_006903, partial [Quaeritorhiza haematococci]